jgi:hypothetical protein
MCKDCHTLLQRERAYNRFKEFGRYNYHLKCKACNADFIASRKTQILCSTCYKESRNGDKSTNEYVYDPESWKESGHIWQHRAIAEKILGRELKSHEVIHHMDHNPKNNAITNLIVISRIMHGKLHLYLNFQRVIIEKSLNENTENCWNNLIVPMTTAWLETTSANVIKIWEIGQSAAEPLIYNKKSIEEGSETKHGTPDHLVEGEDIVQTTTERDGENP